MVMSARIREISCCLAGSLVSASAVVARCMRRCDSSRTASAALSTDCGRAVVGEGWAVGDEDGTAVRVGRVGGLGGASLAAGAGLALATLLGLGAGTTAGAPPAGEAAGLEAAGLVAAGLGLGTPGVTPTAPGTTPGTTPGARGSGRSTDSTLGSSSLPWNTIETIAPTASAATTATPSTHIGTALLPVGTGRLALGGMPVYAAPSAIGATYSGVLRSVDRA
jgi:hypothetical protein